MNKIYDISDLLREASTVRSRRTTVGGGLSAKTSRMLREGHSTVDHDEDGDLMLEMVRDLKRIEDNRWLGVEESFDSSKWQLMVEGYDHIDAMHEVGMREKDPAESGPPENHVDELEEDELEEGELEEDDYISDADGYLVPG